ncbi:MAG: hypothetical protein M5U01_08575 [Ardenticatenaceae bacterium]|nr:hypothetical protein [Ardenticatenaceae bacterium]
MGLWKVLNRLFPAGRAARRDLRPGERGRPKAGPTALAPEALPAPLPVEAEAAAVQGPDPEPMVLVCGRAVDLAWRPPDGATFSETVTAFETQFAAKGWTVVRRRRGEGHGGAMVRWRIRKGMIGGVITVVQANPDGTKVTVSSSFAVND